MKGGEASGRGPPLDVDLCHLRKVRALASGCQQLVEVGPETFRDQLDGAIVSIADPALKRG